MQTKSLTILLASLVLFLPLLSFAQDIKPLVGIPNVTGGSGTSDTSISGYINALYLLSISIGALIAVVKIVIAGAKYMLSEVVPDKQGAIADIKGALLGLLIILAAVVILGTINPQLRDLDVLRDITPATLNTPTERAVPTNLPNGTQVQQITCMDEDCVAELLACQNLPGYVTAQQTGPGQLSCYTRPGNVNFSGPETCPDGEQIVLNFNSTTNINERSCVPIDRNSADVVSEDEVDPGATLVEEPVVILCAVATACNFPTDFGYQVGIASARASCEDIRGGNLVVTGNGTGICQLQVFGTRTGSIQ